MLQFNVTDYQKQPVEYCTKDNDKANWQVGSLCLIYSRSQRQWSDARITKIQGKCNNEWLIVKYGKKTKRIQRNCVDIKAIPIDHASYFKKGSICEIRSESLKLWCNGQVIDIFTDPYGEWLKVKYEENSVMKICDIQRYSCDIKLIRNAQHLTDTNILTFDMNPLDHDNEVNIYNINITNELHLYNEPTEEQPSPMNITLSLHNHNQVKKPMLQRRLTSPKMLMGTKLVISRLKQNKSVDSTHSLNSTPRGQRVPTPVTDKAMFKYFNMIDMGKIRVSSLSYLSIQDSYDEADMSDSISIHTNTNTTTNQLSLPLRLSNNTSKHIKPIIAADVDTDTDEMDDEMDDDDDDSDSGMFGILGMMAEINEATIYAQHGYNKLNKICDILQGELLLVEHIKRKKRFVIKKIDKQLCQQNLVINDDGDNIFTSQDIIKESEILKYLTIENNAYDPIHTAHIIKYEDFFQSEHDYYLVLQYIESETNLRQFIHQSQKYISENKLTLTEYYKTIKKVYFELLITIHYLHTQMSCCHLDLFTENIMLTDCNFLPYESETKENENNIHIHNTYKINPNIKIVVKGFGLSEVFKNNKSFTCNKTDLSIDNESYLAPNIDEDVYDARMADMFTLGHILFECVTGIVLYDPIEIAEVAVQSHARRSTTSLNLPKTKRKSLLESNTVSLLCSEDKNHKMSSTNSKFLINGYWALRNGLLKEYLSINTIHTINKTEKSKHKLKDKTKKKLIQYFDSDSFTLLQGLMKINESQRYDSNKATNHEWFRNEMYYKKYVQQKYEFEMKRNSTKISISNNFPFYNEF